MQDRLNRGVHRLAILTATATLLLLTAGALVTSNDAGDSVPDWPLAYGRLIPPLVGNIRIEFAHRVVAAVVGLLTIILAVSIARVEPRRWVRWLGWSALWLVVAQGILGGVRVLLRNPALSATAHATLAQLFFAAVVSLAVFTSALWQQDLHQQEDAGWPSVRRLTAWTTVAVIVQLILGAAFRHNAFGIIPHIIGAGVVLFVGTWATRAIRTRYGEMRPLRRCGILFQCVLGVQILLGGAAYWAARAARDAVEPTPIYVILSVTHVVVGALVLASSVLMMLAAHRLLISRRVPELNGEAEKVVAS